MLCKMKPFFAIKAVMKKSLVVLMRDV